MWKLVLGFVVFAALALYVLSRGGDIDLVGEKHGDMSHTEKPAAAPATDTPAVPAAPSPAK